MYSVELRDVLQMPGRERSNEKASANGIIMLRMGQSIYRCRRGKSAVCEKS